MLKIQYRMHPSISKFPNEEFYAGGLEDGPNVKDYNNTYLDGHMYGPYSFIHVEDGYEENIGQGSRNIVEADVAANIVARLAEVHTCLNNYFFHRNCMWILGHETTLLQHKTTWSRLVKDAKDRQCFFDARDDYSLARAMDQSVRDNVSRPNIKFQCAPDAQLAGDSCGEASMDNNPTASLHEASHDMMSVDENLLKYSGEASKENQADSSKDNKKIEEKTMCDDSANSAKTKMCDDDKNDVNAEGNKEIQDTTEGNKVKEVPMQAEVAAEKTCQLLPSCSRKRINSLQEDQPAGQFAEQVHLAQLPPRPSRKKACLSQSAPIAQVTVEMAALEDAQIDLLGALPQLAEAVARTPVNYEERKEREKLVKCVNLYEQARSASDERFWSNVHMDLYNSLFSKKKCADNKWIDWGYIRHLPGVRDVETACRNIGLHKLMALKQNWYEEPIKQFYSTLSINRSRTSVTFMAGINKKITVTKRFCQNVLHVSSKHDDKIKSKLTDAEEKELKSANKDQQDAVEKIIRKTIYPLIGDRGKTHGPCRVLQYHILFGKPFDIVDMMFNCMQENYRHKNKTMGYAPYIIAMDIVFTQTHPSDALKKGKEKVVEGESACWGLWLLMKLLAVCPQTSRASQSGTARLSAFRSDAEHARFAARGQFSSKAALSPLKLIERERARGRLLVEKLRMQRTKQTVLNQQMLHPAIRQTKNTCSATYESELNQLIIFTVNCNQFLSRQLACG
ncbi:hypothetical protein HU200_052317 [Digitaria exilis]|uniref:DNA2/NAM7 helicase-like C-terminal domain-containing protein n=1 Tax=Digitaria exilis TaxID=1010633 RepID=A0A835ATG8_9POAL|nr:hypothetical protein HU200_052317 [Digitaria exilis]